MSKLTEEEFNKFDTLTEAYNKLIECQTTLKQASAQVAQDFRTPDVIEKGYYFSNPLDIDYELRKQIGKVKENTIGFILNHMGRKFNNLLIDERDVCEFIEGGEVIQKLGIDKPKPNRPVLQGQFTARAVIQYIEDKYADEETITLQQIKEFASNTLPRVGEFTTEKASKPEHIPVINKTGIELRGGAYWTGHKEDPTAAVIKLIHIKLNHILPSQAEGHNIEYSDVYSDDKIKSLRRYKNGKLKIIFHNEEDMDTIRRVLVGCDE